MYVKAEIVSIKQEWNLQTQESENHLVFIIAGVRLEAAISDEAVGVFVRIASGEPPSRPLHDASKDEADEGADLDFVLGGGHGSTPEEAELPPGLTEEAEAPMMFQDLNPTQQRKAAIDERRASTPYGRRAEAKQEMLARARAVPRRTVEATDMGYPNVAAVERPDAHPHAAVVRTPPPAAADDDGFAQG